MLSTGDLAYMRAQVALLMPDTCSILSGTATSDNMGGYSTAWGTTYAGVSCRLDHRRGQKTLTGGALYAFSQDVLTVPYDTTINTSNRIVHDVVTYTISEIDADKSWPVCIRCSLERVP